MQKKYIENFNDGDVISEAFYIESKSLREARTGKPYVALVLRDKTGIIPAKIWDEADVIFKNLQSAQFIQVNGRVETYENRVQLRVSQVRTVKKEDVDLADFLPSTEKDTNEMLSELISISEQIDNEYLKKLLNSFFSDDDFVEKFKICPGAKSIHHAYLGGLLEHTLSVLKICLFLCDHYENLNKDLLISGAILHDIGKINELSTTYAVDYTTEGRLIGHTVLGYRMVEEKIRQIEDFPEDLKMGLEHLLLSHQGKYEFGAPVIPQFAEAFILHYVDDMDVRVQMTQHHIESDKTEDSEFTTYHKILERSLYKGFQEKTE